MHEIRREYISSVHNESLRIHLLLVYQHALEWSYPNVMGICLHPWSNSV